ncbi:hypothetical protein ACJX0J_028343, partial [Zea mays]
MLVKVMVFCEAVLSIALENEAIDFVGQSNFNIHIIGNWSIVKKEQSCLILKYYIILKYSKLKHLELEATTEVNVSEKEDEINKEGKLTIHVNKASPPEMQQLHLYISC